MAASRKLYRELASEFEALLAAAADTGLDTKTLASAARCTAYALKRDNIAFRYDLLFEACGLDSFGKVAAA